MGAQERFRVEAKNWAIFAAVVLVAVFVGMLLFDGGPRMGDRLRHTALVELAAIAVMAYFIIPDWFSRWYGFTHPYKENWALPPYVRWRLSWSVPSALLIFFLVIPTWIIVATYW